MESPQESPSQKQARLRREKREKKILSGGASRLEQITSLSSGRPAEASSTPETVSAPQSTQSISTPSQKPAQKLGPRESVQEDGPTQAQLEASMREFLAAPAPVSRLQARPQDRPKAGSRTRSEDDVQEQQDPMLAMLQQMMSGSMPQADGSAPSFDGLPAGLAAMLGGGAGGGDATAAHGQVPARNVYAWKIAHALFALGMGVYVLWTYAFSGTELARMRPRGLEAGAGSVFWMFVTAELGLQGARYLLEGGAVEEGMVKSIAGFLPQPWRRRVELGSRYVRIWTTLVQDAFVIVFLLGVVAWWKG